MPKGSWPKVKLLVTVAGRVGGRESGTQKVYPLTPKPLLSVGFGVSLLYLDPFSTSSACVTLNRLLNFSVPHFTSL